MSDTAPIKAYVGGVNVATIQATSEATTLAVLCEAKQAVAVAGDRGDAAVAQYDSQNGPACPANYSEVGVKKSQQNP